MTSIALLPVLPAFLWELLKGAFEEAIRLVGEFSERRDVGRIGNTAFVTVIVGRDRERGLRMWKTECGKKNYTLKIICRKIRKILV